MRPPKSIADPENLGLIPEGFTDSNISSELEKEGGSILPQAIVVKKIFSSYKKFSNAIEALFDLDHPGNLIEKDGAEGSLFVLSQSARNKLSESIKNVLILNNIDLGSRSVESSIRQLEELIKEINIGLTAVISPQNPGTGEVETVNTGEQVLKICPAEGILRFTRLADLLVVKQHIKRYEPSEIAHVENVLKGETKSRTHRQFDRTEETFLTEIETTREKENELESATRFEINEESSKTIQKDQQFGFGLSLSGKYGPTVEFSSEFEMNIERFEEESKRSATNYANEIVERSVERIAERNLERRTRTVIHEVEETNLHELKNESEEHTAGIYQFLDKVYETQVFNYGIRQIFDFMVPEPASYLWHLDETQENGLDLPKPPERLEKYAKNASYIDRWNYIAIGGKFGANDLETPPDLYKTVSVAIHHGGEGASEEDPAQPRSTISKDIDIPEGYQPVRAVIRGLSMTDDDQTIAINIGNKTISWQPSGGQQVDLGENGYKIAIEPQLGMTLTDLAYSPEEQTKLPVNLIAFETNNYAVSVNIVSKISKSKIINWQTRTYEAIAAAHQDRQFEYEQKVEQIEAEKRAEEVNEEAERFGLPPSENKKIVARELKKHCIAILSRQNYDFISAMNENNPPSFEFDRAEIEGHYIRFFEQAFEWDQLQYVFYPYFWARKKTWPQRFSRQSTDPQFKEFLQAGEARAVVSVRPGFESVVTYFLQTGCIWNGVGNPILDEDGNVIEEEVEAPYLPIIQEIVERADQPGDEVPVGDSWETKLPTSLVMLRKDDSLPKWKKVEEEAWQWIPDE